MSDFFVLRMGHRPERDKRITTHVSLTARAFGASKIFLSKPDSRVVSTVSDVVEKFGGGFEIETVSNPKKFVKNWDGKIVHLTMFGLPLDDFIVDIRNEKSDILFVVGAEKVPPWIFEYADYNISIGNQPHSEVSALAIALCKIDETAYNTDFEGHLRVIPSADYRNMVDTRSYD